MQFFERGASPYLCRTLTAKSFFAVISIVGRITILNIDTLECCNSASLK